MPAPRPLLRYALLLTLLGCRCSNLAGEVDGLTFIRCPQVSPPAERGGRLGTLGLSLRDRVLELTAARPLAIAAFSGPVGGRLAERDLAALAQAGTGLVLMLGGIGDEEQTAKQNLAALAASGMPTLFLAGGGDRWPVVEAAFEALAPSARDRVLNASGLRELRIGGDRFIIVAGAPFGRYAMDDQSCGFTAADLDDVRAAASGGTGERTWLLSWHAPAGFGVSEGYGGTEIGSPDLRALALAIGAKGGVFGYPEGQAGQPRKDDGPLALVVPRLGPTGVLRADGSRLPSGFARLVLAPEGLFLAP